MPRIDSIISSEPSGIEVAAARSRAELKERWRKLPDSPISFVISTSSALAPRHWRHRKCFVEPGSRTEGRKRSPERLGCSDQPSSRVWDADMPRRNAELHCSPGYETRARTM